MTAEIINGKIVFFPANGTELYGIKHWLLELETKKEKDIVLSFDIDPTEYIHGADGE